MKLKVDQRADALYLTLTETPASWSEEISPGIIVDYDDQDRVVGIEILIPFQACPGGGCAEGLVRVGAANRLMEDIPAHTTIDRLRITLPHDEPHRHRRYDQETRTLDLLEVRRPACHVAATLASKSFDDFGILAEIAPVSEIRRGLKALSKVGYQGVTSMAKRLLQYRRDTEEFETQWFYFCRSVALETVIWLVEVPLAERVGIESPSDGGEFVRQCRKKATQDSGEKGTVDP